MPKGSKGTKWVGFEDGYGPTKNPTMSFCMGQSIDDGRAFKQGSPTTLWKHRAHAGQILPYASNGKDYQGKRKKGGGEYGGSGVFLEGLKSILVLHSVGTMLLFSYICWKMDMEGGGVDQNVSNMKKVGRLISNTRRLLHKCGNIITT